jgi:hypothetical protein
VIAAAAALAAALLALALYLGGWAFVVRSSSLHERRLQNLLKLKPKLEQVVAGLTASTEGMALVGTAESREQMEALARRWAGPQEAAVLAKGKGAARMLVFSGNDVVYFISFDAERTMTAYAYVVG